MELLQEIRQKIAARQYEYSKHAVDQSIIRRIGVPDVEQALLSQSEVVEDYPDDKYGPSCLILGFTNTGRALHVHCSHPSRSLVKIITVYEPDSERWLDYRRRRHQ